jgi:Arc-like DNA binding dprotein
MVRKAQVPRIVMTRMPEGLHARLRKEAKANRRSVNREIIDRLMQSFHISDQTKAVVDGVVHHLYPEIVKFAAEVIKQEQEVAKELSSKTIEEQSK